MNEAAKKPDNYTAAMAGKLYVYTGEDRDAISVAMNGVGPNGGWVGISIARMALPDKHKTQEQLNAFARKFAASDDMLAALKDAAVRMENAAKAYAQFSPDRHQWTEWAAEVRAVISKAEGP